MIRASVMRALHGGALRAAMPAVADALHAQFCFSQSTVALLRSAAPLTVRGEEVGHFLSWKCRRVSCYTCFVFQIDLVVQ